MPVIRWIVTQNTVTKENLTPEILENKLLDKVKVILNCQYEDGILRPCLTHDFFKNNSEFLKKESGNLAEILDIYKRNFHSRYLGSVLTRRCKILLADLEQAWNLDTPHSRNYYLSIGIDPNRVINTFLDDIFAIFSYHFNEYFDEFHELEHEKVRGTVKHCR